MISIKLQDKKSLVINKVNIQKSKFGFMLSKGIGCNKSHHSLRKYFEEIHLKIPIDVIQRKKKLYMDKDEKNIKVPN